MPNGSTKPVIFISYSHKDEPEHPHDGEIPWLSFVRTYLQPAIKNGVFNLFVDEHLSGGDDLKPEIERKLHACDVFILLISANSTSSDYIVDTEIKVTREREANGEDVCFYPVLLTPTPKIALDKFKDKVVRPRDAKPLSAFPYGERIQKMTEIADEIAKIATDIAGRKPEPPRRGPQPTYVHISGLPETPYERLVGREAELKRLDDAWADTKTNILSLVAEGGAGKSALVNEWLKQLQADGYRGAEAVLGWSFYSQGTKERTTSADEFLNWTLDKLGITVTTTSATAKGEAIAEAMMRHRVLLLLDGVEPLQHGPGPQLGQLKDLGLRALLRRFAATPPRATHGLVVLTSRLAVTDIARWQDGAAPVVEVERLSDEAGAALLRDNGVWGTDKELKAAAHDFGGHPLALGLLASFLKETQTGDVRRRDHIRGYFADADNPRHDHARRVMESYETEWLAGQPVLLAIMHMVGLFDQPASSDCLKALRKKPAIKGLTDQIVKLDEGEWQRAVTRLREMRLLAAPDPATPDALDAHPLVREWFGERLMENDKSAWGAAHFAICDHLRRKTREGDAPTLQQLAPFYQAISHGCYAGRHQETLDNIYRRRICREDAPRKPTFYSKNKLGAFGSDLAAISCFFDKPYSVPVSTIRPADQSWVLGEAGVCLHAQGRFEEALSAQRAALRMDETAHYWRNAASAAEHVCRTELLLGEVVTAVGSAARAVALADRSADETLMVTTWAVRAEALHASGLREDAERLFVDTSRRHAISQPSYPLLYSLPGFQYCDFLLGKGNAAATRDYLARTIQWAKLIRSPIESGLQFLNLGRAHLGLALENSHQQFRPSNVDNARSAHAALDESMGELRVAGQIEFTTRCLLARVAFRRSVGDWEGAARDLDEVEEIAEPGPMRLFLCDMALERARLAFARSEAFAPLNGLIDDSPPKPERPGEAERKSLHDEAEKQLIIAADYIEKCGYHRRDEELAELQAVLRGDRTFASLPPRV